MLDDAGVGDLDPDNGQIDTPNVGRLARQGMTFTQMYCGSSICSPSRAALLTGRYSVRVGIPQVLHEGDDTGLSRWERTIAELLHAKGYATGIFGKWHLGFKPWFNPVHHGFDRFVGVMHSGFHRDEQVRLYEGTKRMSEGMDQAYLTRRFTDEALAFIKAQHRRRRPFFAYIPYTAPHLPLHVEPGFQGRSDAGKYGDVVQVVDFHIGRILDTLDELGLTDETVVAVTSDNGPWFQGSTGGLRGRKTDFYEGGIRAPFFIRWPGYIPAGSRSGAIASFLDILPTFCRMAGAEVPDDRPIDGIDLRRALRGRSMPTRPPLAFFERWHLAVVRYKQWKLMIPRKDEKRARQRHQLFNIARDPFEQYDQGPTHPRVEQRLEAIADKIRKEVDKEKPEAVRRARQRPGPERPEEPEEKQTAAFGTSIGAGVAILLGAGLWAGYGRRVDSRRRMKAVPWGVVVLGVIAGLVALVLYLT